MEVDAMKSQYEPFINAILLMINIVSVVGIVTINKLIFTHFKFNFGTLLTFIHFGVTSILLEFGQLFGWIAKNKSKIGWIKVLPLSVAFCGFVVLTNLSLQYNSISLYQMAKVMTTPIIILLQFSFYNKKFSRSILASLAVTCAGVLLATATEVKISILGTLAAIAACLITAIYSIWIETEQQRLGLNALQLLSYQAPLSAMLLVGFIPILDDFKAILRFKMISLAALAILTSALLAFLVNVSTFMIIGKMSAITYNIAGHAKLCFVLAAGYLLFDYKFYWMNMIGVFMAISGVISYSMIKMMTPATPRTKFDDDLNMAEIDLTPITVAEPKRSLLIFNNEPVLSLNPNKISPIIYKSEKESNSENGYSEKENLIK